MSVRISPPAAGSNGRQVGSVRSPQLVSRFRFSTGPFNGFCLQSAVSPFLTLLPPSCFAVISSRRQREQRHRSFMEAQHCICGGRQPLAGMR